MSSPPRCFQRLEFDLSSALLKDLVEIFENHLEMAPLAETSVSRIPEGQGVYQLFHEGVLVYIGKTDSDAGLNSRLTRHSRKIQHRLHLDPTDVSFKAIQVYVFTPMDLETSLIKHYTNGPASSKPGWTSSGFGSNDPGRRRDKGKHKEGHFDTMYPIDIDRRVSLRQGGARPASEVLAELKQIVPYVIRYQGKTGRSRAPHPDLEQTQVRIHSPQQTVRDFLVTVSRALPDDWQITVLPGRIIAYKESADYPDVMAVY